MSVCDNCNALLHEPTTASPHAALRGGAVYTHSGGILERYTCQQCVSTWDRLKSKDERYSPKWEMLLAGRLAAA